MRKKLDKVSRQWASAVNVQEEDYRTYPSIPEPLLVSLQNAVSAITGLHQRESHRRGRRPPAFLLRGDAVLPIG